MFKGASQRRIREHDDRAWLAWHTANLTAYAPAQSQKFIKIEKLYHKPESNQANRQTPDQQLAIARSWTSSRRG